MPGSRLAVVESPDQQPNTYLVLTGDLDAHTAGDLATALGEVPASANRIVLDMAGIEFIDSAGLGVIVEHDRQRGPGVLVLRNLTGRVEKVMEYAGLLEHLTIE